MHTETFHGESKQSRARNFDLESKGIPALLSTRLASLCSVLCVRSSVGAATHAAQAAAAGHMLTQQVQQV